MSARAVTASSRRGEAKERVKRSEYGRSRTVKPIAIFRKGERKQTDVMEKYISLECIV
jgi:hypothetical protein